MLAIATALLASAASAAPADALSLDDLPQVFAAACLDGEARLSPASASAVAFDELPSPLRRSLRRPLGGGVWKLNVPGRSYLYVLEYQPARGVSPKVCGLASDRLPLKTATDALELRITGSLYPRRKSTAEWFNAKHGYMAVATPTAEFSVVQINWLNELDRKRAKRALRGVTP